MSRSTWKGPHVFSKKIQKNKNHYYCSRSSVIVPFFIGKKISVFCGIRIFTVFVTNKMVGHKVGEFIFNRVDFKFKRQK